MQKEQMNLTFLFYPATDCLDKITGHCLELDVIAVEDDLVSCCDLLKELVDTQITYCLKNKMDDTLFTPAPQKFWTMLASAKKIDLPKSKRRVKNIIDSIKFNSLVPV